MLAAGGAGLMLSPRLAFSDTMPTIAYDSVHNLLRLPPDLYFGEVSGVALNSKGHVFVLSRGNTIGPAYGAAVAQLLQFGSDGRFLREIEHNLYAWSFAHTVKVDPHDNIWVTDKGSDSRAWTGSFRLIGLVYALLLSRAVMSDRTANRSTNNSMMASDVPCNAAYGRTG